MSEIEPTTRHNIVERLQRLLENCQEHRLGNLTEDLEDEDFELFDEWLDHLRYGVGDFFGTEGQCDPAGDQRG